MQSVIKWHKINSSKDNPEEEGTYIVAFRFGKKDYKVGIAEYTTYPSEWELSEDYSQWGADNIKIVSWAELPEIPRK